MIKADLSRISIKEFQLLLSAFEHDEDFDNLRVYPDGSSYVFNHLENDGQEFDSLTALVSSLKSKHQREENSVVENSRIITKLDEFESLLSLLDSTEEGENLWLSFDGSSTVTNDAGIEQKSFSSLEELVVYLSKRREQIARGIFVPFEHR